MSDNVDLDLWESSVDLSKLEIYTRNEWEKFKDRYQRETGTKWSFYRNKSVEALQKGKKKIIHAKTHYGSIDWQCELAGQPTAVRSHKTECPAYMKLILDDTEIFLRVSDYSEYHNHEQFLHSARWFRPEVSPEQSDSTFVQAKDSGNKRKCSALEDSEDENFIEQQSKRNHLAVNSLKENGNFPSTSTESFETAPELENLDESVLISSDKIAGSNIPQDVHKNVPQHVPGVGDVVLSSGSPQDKHGSEENEEVIITPKEIENVSHEEIISTEDPSSLDEISLSEVSCMDEPVDDQSPSTSAPTETSVSDNFKKPVKKKVIKATKIVPINMKSLNVKEKEKWLLQKLVKDYDYDMKPEISLLELDEYTGESLSDVFVQLTSDDVQKLKNFFEQAAFEKFEDLIDQKTKEQLLTCPSCRLSLGAVEGHCILCCGCLHVYHCKCIFMMRRPKKDWFCSACLSCSREL